MSETIVEGLQAVAEHFRKSVRQVRNWRREGMPVLSGDRYDLVQIESWRAQKKGGRGPAAPDGRQPALVREGDKDYQDMRAKRAMADLRELEYKLRRGEVVERKEVEQLFVSRIMAVKQGLLNLSRSLPPQLSHCQEEREMEILIARAVRELLDDFSRPLPAGLGPDSGASGEDLGGFTSS